MALKGKYEGEETPLERLRNKLQPLFFIVEMLYKGEDVGKMPEVIEGANDNLDDIRKHLDDIEPYYKGDNMNDLTVKEIIRKHGKN